MKKYTLENFDFFLQNNIILKNLLSDDDFVNSYKDWRIGVQSSFHDYIWSLFNQAIIKNGEIFGWDMDRRGWQKIELIPHPHIQLALPLWY